MIRRPPIGSACGRLPRGAAGRRPIRSSSNHGALLTGSRSAPRALVRWLIPASGLLGGRATHGRADGPELSAARPGRVLELAVAVAAGWAEQDLNWPSGQLSPRCIGDPALTRTALAELLAQHGAAGRTAHHARSPRRSRPRRAARPVDGPVARRRSADLRRRFGTARRRCRY